MKKIFFAFPALAFTLFLAFCQKSNVQEEVVPTNIGVTDRGTCVIEIFADNLNQLRICGIPGQGGTLDPCNLCPSGNASSGVNVIHGYGIFTVTSPMAFSITNAGATATYVKVTPGGAVSGTNWIQLAANGGCEDFNVANDCTVTN